MPEAKILLDVKDDRVFSYLLYTLQKAFYEAEKGEEKKEIEMPVKEDGKWKIKKFTKLLFLRFKRGIQDISRKIDLMQASIKKEYGYAIREGRIKLDFQYKEKGGIITIDLKGTEEEIIKWTRVSWKEKIGMKAIKKWIEIKVVK